ncbi:hypothetical protein SAMN05216343_10835 [Oscillibacter sp. PC13]|uniref:HlyD family efflux transporter periplasmic adaptor subunit n=1 Tax=Oscillibacter sp. PC13 TaxID=1855299 RepID=UPI0008F3568E|nr:HlyD family efflux transporter periplasmic adaptor subunit [Oscillibacter sp. PC13]SFP48329.1 hypothetical protein SAMN05216343_10835 [Oscillibacter sp. PC13]
MKNSSIGTKLLLAAVTLAILAYFGMQGLRYFGDPLTTTLAYSYQVEESVDLSGYVVRDEQVLPDDSTSGLLRLQRTEGERISAGGVVATVYADQASLDRQNEMDALQTRIEQLQYAEEAALGSEVSLKLDNQIMQSILDFRSDLTADRLDRAEAHGSTLRSLVLKRDYTYTDTADLTGQITELQTQLKTLQSQAAASTRRITAPKSGLYSAVVDGYETVLTPATLETLTPSQLDALTPDEAVRSEAGKLILGDAWYYAVAMDAEEAALLQEQGQLTLRFSKSVERDLSVAVSAVGPEENGQVVTVFRGKTYLPQLTLLRQQSAEIILREIEGIRVPKEALRAEKVSINEDGSRTVTEQTGIYCVVGAEARFKPVKVLYNGDGFVLVRSTLEDLADITAVQEKTRLRPGDEVIITANDLYDGKVVG